MKNLIIRPSSKVCENSIYFNRLCFNGDFDLSDEFVFDTNFSSEDCKESLKYLNKYFQKNIDQIVNKLQLNSKNEFPLSFWKSVLYPFIFPRMSLIYKYELILKDINKGETKFTTEILKKNKPEFELEIKYIRPYNQFYVLSKILSNISYEKIKIINEVDLKPNQSPFKNKFSLKNILFKKISNFFFFRTIVPGYGIDFIDAIVIYFRLIKQSKSNFSVIKNNEPQKTKFCENWRTDLIIDMLPTNFTQDTINYLTKYKNIEFSPGRINLVQNKIYNDLENIIYYNLAKLRGEKIIPSQHGGHIFSNTNAYRKHVECDKDAYLVWGENVLKRTKKFNSIVVSSPLFSKIYNQNSPIGDKILLVGTHMQNFNIGFWGWFINNNDSWKYRNDKIELINSIYNSYNDILHYRPYNSNTRYNNLEDMNYIKQKFHKIKILGGNLNNNLKTYKILILDHPGTTLSYGLAINIPVLIFLPNYKYFSIKKRHGELFDEMKELKILHTSIESITKQLSEVVKKPKAWWNTKKIQSFRSKYLNSYALINKNWRDDLIKKLNESKF